MFTFILVEGSLSVPHLCSGPLRTMTRRTYKLASLFFFIFGVTGIIYAVAMFSVQHEDRWYCLTGGVFGLITAGIVRLGASRKQGRSQSGLAASAPLSRFSSFHPGWLSMVAIRKAGYVNLAGGLASLLLAVIIISPLGAGPGALESEKVFMAALHNSLGHLDQAKWQWAEEKHKAEQDIPTMEELIPYLGDWTNSIARFVALGIDFKITGISELEPQSDVATLTRDLRFGAGICRFYPAGTSYCLHTGWAPPQSGSTSWFVASYHDNRELLAAALFVLALGNLLLFAVRRIRSLSQVSRLSPEHHNVYEG